MFFPSTKPAKGADRNVFHDPLVTTVASKRVEVWNTITALCFAVGGAVGVVLTKFLPPNGQAKNRMSAAYLFLCASVLLSIGTIVCHSFLPNNLEWADPLAMCIGTSALIAIAYCSYAEKGDYSNAPAYCIAISLVVCVGYFGAYKSVVGSVTQESPIRSVQVGLNAYLIPIMFVVFALMWLHFYSKGWNLFAQWRFWLFAILFGIGMSLSSWAWPMGFSCSPNCKQSNTCAPKCVGEEGQPVPFHAISHIAFSVVALSMYGLMVLI